MEKTKYNKRTLAEFIEQKAHPIAFFGDLLRRLHAHRKSLNKAREIGIIDFFQDSIYCDHKSDADIFFILGGGPSINNLSSQDWSIIKRNKSLGLNLWFVHEFEPNFLMTEGFRQEDVGSDIYEWKAFELKKYMSCSSSILLLKDLSTSFLPWVELFSIAPDRIFSLAHLSVPGRSNESQQKAMGLIRRMSLHESYPIFTRVSVTLAMSIGYHLGFKKIVLCGVDLNDGLYFWEERNFSKHPEVSIPLGSGQKNKKLHSTVNPEVNQVTADMSILSMTNLLLRPSGVEVFVSSDSSRLFPRLPKFDFTDAKK